MKSSFKIILASFVALGMCSNLSAKEMDACELADQFLDIDKAVALCLAPTITNERVIILFNWILEDDWGNGDIDLYLDTLETVKKAIKVDEYLRIKAKIYSIFKNQNETYKKKSLDLYKQAADLGNADAASIQLMYGPSLTASERIRYLKIAAEGGDANKQASYAAQLIDISNRTDTDVKAGLHYLEMSALAGNTNSAVQLLKHRKYLSETDQLFWEVVVAIDQDNFENNQIFLQKINGNKEFCQKLASSNVLFNPALGRHLIPSETTKFIKAIGLSCLRLAVVE